MVDVDLFCLILFSVLFAWFGCLLIMLVGVGFVGLLVLCFYLLAIFVFYLFVLLPCLLAGGWVVFLVLLDLRFMLAMRFVWFCLLIVLLVIMPIWVCGGLNRWLRLFGVVLVLLLFAGVGVCCICLVCWFDVKFVNFI